MRQNSVEGTYISEGNYISALSKIHETVQLEAPVRTYGTAAVRERCSIGAFSFVNQGTTLFRDTSVGRFCSIGKYCEIGAFDHPTEWLSSSPFQYNMGLHFPDHADRVTRKTYNRPGGVAIGNDVWIGSGVIVRRGVTIGDGAVIAGGAVVIGDVAPYSIVGGVPARHLRHRFSPEIIERLQATAWWNRPVEELGNLPYDDIEATLAQLECETDLKREPADVLG